MPPPRPKSAFTASSGMVSTKSRPESAAKPKEYNKRLLKLRMRRGKLYFVDNKTGCIAEAMTDSAKQNCLCTICTCGAHHCPEHKRYNVPFTASSEYRKSFPARSPERPKPVGPENTVDPTTYTQGHFNTTSREAFRSPPEAFTPPPPIKPRDANLATANRRFVATSTNRADYQGHSPSPSKRFAVAEKLPAQLPFTGSSVAHDSYVVPPPELYVKKPEYHNSRMVPPRPFTATTTNLAQFQAPPAGTRPAPSCKPHDNVVDFDAHFPHDSAYHITYTPKKINICPSSRLRQHTPSPLTGHVHYLQTGNDKWEPGSYSPAKAIKTL
eukprot:TRINITY_DN84924_c0_g1_i1.p1 TRINITY_DN84924_c0_g1~~TRINITY_DN84924_c0_g1_i1.p1  ORF type:complete len:326 (-),score=24.14 TRINITY_DN84924_c0_g1_i1:452-1429(-)